MSISDTKFVSQFLHWTGFTAYWNYLNILNERILYASYMNLFYWWRCFCWLCEIGAHFFFMMNLLHDMTIKKLQLTVMQKNKGREHILLWKWLFNFDMSVKFVFQSIFKALHSRQWSICLSSFIFPEHISYPFGSYRIKLELLKCSWVEGMQWPWTILYIKHEVIE